MPGWIESPVFDIADLSTLEVQVKVTKGGATSSVGNRTYECWFQSLSAPPWSQVAVHQGTLVGDGSTGYGEIFRPFPGRDPVAGLVIFGANSFFVSQIWIKSPSGEPSHDVEIVMHNDWDDTDLVVAIILKEDIGTGWFAHAARYKVQTDMLGDYHFYARSLATGQIHVVNMMVNRGSLVYPWTPNPEMQGYQGEEPLGQVSQWPISHWVATTAGRYAAIKAEIV